MICKSCVDKDHYWFASVYEDMPEDEFDEYMNNFEREIGIYAFCDMRQVFSTLTSCECGCHEIKVAKEDYA